MYSISLLPNFFHSGISSVPKDARVIVKIEIYSLKLLFTSRVDVAASVAPVIYYFRMRSGTNIRFFEFLQPQHYQSSYIDVFKREINEKFILAIWCIGPQYK